MIFLGSTYLLKSRTQISFCEVDSSPFSSKRRTNLPLEIESKNQDGFAHTHKNLLLKSSSFSINFPHIFTFPQVTIPWNTTPFPSSSHFSTNLSPFTKTAHGPQILNSSLNYSLLNSPASITLYVYINSLLFSPPVKSVFCGSNLHSPSFESKVVEKKLICFPPLQD